MSGGPLGGDARLGACTRCTPPGSSEIGPSNRSWPLPEPTTWLGNWYGTVLFPVLMPLAPAATLLDRFPDAFSETVASVGVDPVFIVAELAEMGEGQWTKTANRSVIGVMNEFGFLANQWRQPRDSDPVEVALWLAETPCGPLYRRQGSPDRELAAAVAAWSARHDG